jgi:hypothetical protein
MQLGCELISWRGQPKLDGECSLEQYEKAHWAAYYLCVASRVASMGRFLNKETVELAESPLENAEAVPNTIKADIENSKKIRDALKREEIVLLDNPHTKVPSLGKIDEKAKDAKSKSEGSVSTRDLVYQLLSLRAEESSRVLEPEFQSPSDSLPRSNSPEMILQLHQFLRNNCPLFLNKCVFDSALLAKREAKANRVNTASAGTSEPKTAVAAKLSAASPAVVGSTAVKADEVPHAEVEAASSSKVREQLSKLVQKGFVATQWSEGAWEGEESADQIRLLFVVSNTYVTSFSDTAHVAEAQSKDKDKKKKPAAEEEPSDAGAGPPGDKIRPVDFNQGSIACRRVDILEVGRLLGLLLHRLTATNVVERISEEEGGTQLRRIVLLLEETLGLLPPSTTESLSATESSRATSIAYSDSCPQCTVENVAFLAKMFDSSSFGGTLCCSFFVDFFCTNVLK